MEERYRIRRKASGEQPEYVQIKRRGIDLGAMAAAQKAAQADDAEEAVALTADDMRALKNLVRYYEKTVEYLFLRKRPLHVIGINLLSGMAKGFGIAIGITVIAFIAVRLLNSLQILNLPIIGDFIAELLDYIENVQKLGNI